LGDFLLFLYMAKKIKVARTRNNGTMTESAFWSMIRSALRQKSRWWKPVAQAKLLARRKNQSGNKKLRWEYKCAECQNWYPEKNIQVDHIDPAGTLKSYSDLPGFVERLFCEVEGLQCLCTKCHDIKTKKENEERS
jgi:hypothetical protein